MKTIELSSELIKLHKYEGSADKSAAVDLIKTYLEKNDLHVELISSNGVVSVIGSTKGRKENSRKIILNGHYDTVPPSDQWTVDPFDPVVKKGELWGLGACDMTCNLAAMINTAIAISKQNLSSEIILIAVGDEEVGGHNGTGATIAKGITANYAVIGEPTAMQLATGHKARLQIELTAEGKGGHAAYPQDTKNAAHTMATALVALEKEFKLKSHDHEYVFSHPTMNTTLISGGTAENVVPFQCKATIDFRLPADIKIEKFTAKLTQLLPESVKLNIQKNEPGWISDEKSEFIKTAQATLEKVTGTPISGYLHKLGASDARYYSKAGIPTINVGAGNMKLHIPDEKMQLEQLRQVEQFYTELCKKI